MKSWLHWQAPLVEKMLVIDIWKVATVAESNLKNCTDSHDVLPPLAEFDIFFILIFSHLKIV